jgi:hypothetical protein
VLRRLLFIHGARFFAALLGTTTVAHAATLLAPQVHATGVDAATASSFEILLCQEIERVSPRLLRSESLEASRPCAEPTCVGRRARRAAADGGWLCTLARLGAEYVVTLQRVDAAGKIDWSERVSVRRQEDLDTAAEQLARAVRGERIPRTRTPPPAENAASDSVLAATLQPKPSWSTQGPRVGRLSPLGDAYAGAGALTSLAYVWRYQTPSFNVEVIPALGLAWGGDTGVGNGRARDWTLLDVFVAWTPIDGDLGPYIGVGLGLHSIKLEREADGVPFAGKREAGETAPTLAIGCGLLLFRSYDFQVGLDLRFQHFTYAFDSLGGDGARGFSMTFGIQHR